MFPENRNTISHYSPFTIDHIPFTIPLFLVTCNIFGHPSIFFTRFSWHQLYMYLKAVLIVSLSVLSQFLQAQVCTTPGQTPVSAILICSQEPIVQPVVPICGGTTVPACSDPFLYQDKNPFWYKMTCYTPGTLGFTITPGDGNADFNWELFDITNRNPVDVYTDASMLVAGNWSTDPGETGASIDGTSLLVCYGSYPLFSQMPQLLPFHEYLLMVSNQSGTPGGYSLSISGGTASITDPVEPKLLQARQSCDGTKVIIKFNRSVRCSSIAPDGSDFSINGGYSITSATTPVCNNNTTDSAVLSINNPLANGNYTITINNGADGNTALDICNRPVPTGSQLNFSVGAVLPTPMDSLVPPSCKPTKLRLIFSRPIQCSSIAGNGSDFQVTGPEPVTISSITTACTTGPNPPVTTYFIEVVLTSPVITGGDYVMHLKNGTDGNTIIDECGRITPAGTTLTFKIPSGVAAGFRYDLQSTCKNNTVAFAHDGANGVNNWQWSFDNSSTSNLQNPVKSFSTAGQHTIKLIVTNGNCIDTASQTIDLAPGVKASFSIPDALCPGDAVIPANTSSGVVDRWQWDFGNNTFSNLQHPSVFNYPTLPQDAAYTITLIAFNNTLNCSDTASKTIRVLSGCTIAVPTAFTPNDDGKNDFLYPLNATAAADIIFQVYNRYGQLVFESHNASTQWDGRYKGQRQDTGVYAWMLSYTLPGSGKKIFTKGTTLLIR